MKVFLLSGNGRMGPWLIEALSSRHPLLITDVKAPPGEIAHEFRKFDISDTDAVISAVAGMDAIINLSVQRREVGKAFTINTVGKHNVWLAAVHHGIRRIINTGPHFQVSGPQYED